MRITWVSTGSRRLSNEGQLRRSATRWAQEFLAPSRRRGPDGILTTRASGSSARSVQGTSGHGLLRPKRAIDFRRLGLNHGSVPRLTSPAETIQTRKLLERSIPFFRRGTTLE